MANRYANLVGSNKIKDEWQKINVGFDKVQQEMDAKPDKSIAQVNNVQMGTDDTLTIEGSTGITISTNPEQKKVIITATGTSTPGPHGSAHSEFGADPIPLATTTEGGLMSARDKAKLSDLCFSVKEFGAIGDGVTDDTVAIQNAIAAAEVAGGGIVFFPRGTYIVSDLYVQGNILFRGVGNGSIIKKKNNSVGSSTGDPKSYLFNITSANVTVQFENLVLDGNYDGQITTYDGKTIANNGVINNFVSGDVVLAGGGWISTLSAIPSSPSDRLVVRIVNCKLQKSTQIGIYFDTAIDVGAYAELFVHNCEFYQAGPSIIEYHDGTSLYDGIQYPASGYSNYPSGVTAVFIRSTDSAAINISNCSFIETRDPLAGTITAGYDYNMYNLPASAIWVSSNSVNDPTPEWSRVNISNSYFKDLGRTYATGNGIGVIDLYSRGGPVVIEGNVFERNYGSPIRGKTNAKEVTIAGNVVDTVINELGINIGPANHPSQRGNYTITGNVIKNAGSGIQVTGTNTPAENSDPDIPDDPDSAVNNIVITDNVIENIDTPTFANPVLESGLATYGWGIQVRFASNVTIAGNVIKNLTGTSAAKTEHGIYVRNCIDELSISGNVIDTVPQRGIVVGNHAGNVSVCGNLVKNTGAEGIAMSNAGKNIANNNMISNTGSSGIVVGSSAAESVMAVGNMVKDVLGNSASHVYGIDSGSLGSGSIVISNNYVDGVANSGSGSAYGIRGQFSSFSDSNTITIEGNTILGIEESGVFLHGGNIVLSNNTFKQCNTSGSASHGAIFLNGVAVIGLAQITGNRVDSTTSPYPTTGGASGDTMRNNGKIHESNNSWQSRQIWRNAVPSSGSWNVGDIVWNSNPSAGGNIGWVCVAAGSPGTWKPFGTIST